MADRARQEPVCAGDLQRVFGNALPVGAERGVFLCRVRDEGTKPRRRAGKRERREREKKEEGERERSSAADVVVIIIHGAWDCLVTEITARAGFLMIVFGATRVSS